MLKDALTERTVLKFIFLKLSVWAYSITNFLITDRTGISNLIRLSSSTKRHEDKSGKRTVHNIYIYIE
jgi:hypothetical protein